MKKNNSLDVQIGGNHYKKFVIQPVEFITKNQLGYIEGCIIKYICRFREKGGKEDLLKIRHYIDLLIDLEYANQDKNIDIEQIIEHNTIFRNPNDQIQ